MERWPKRGWHAPVVAVVLMAVWAGQATAQDPPAHPLDHPLDHPLSSFVESLVVLGENYEAGDWVRQSDLLAYMWYLLAATAGHEPANAARHRMARRLSPAEIAAAQALARQCHATNYWRCGEAGTAEDLATIPDSASVLQ